MKTIQEHLKMNVKEFEENVLGHLSPSVELFSKVYAGKILRQIREEEYPNQLPALIQTLIDCKHFNAFGRSATFESTKRKIQNWIQKGVPLNHIPILAKCLNKDIKSFLPDVLFDEVAKSTIDEIYKEKGLSLIINEIKNFIENKISSKLNEALDILREVKDTVNNKIDINIIENEKECYKYIQKRTQEVKKSIDIVNFLPLSPEKSPTEERKEYFQFMSNFMKSNNHIKFRRVVSITTHDKCLWIKRDIELLKNIINYHVGCYKYPKTYIPSYILMIFDEEYVFMGIYNEPINPDHTDKNLWISSKPFAIAVTDYYNVLWDNSIKLKQGPKINDEELNIEKYFLE